MQGKANKRNIYLLKIYILLWRIVLPRPIMKALNLSYHNACIKLLGLSGINDREKNFFLKKKVFLKYTIELDIAKTTQRIIFFESVYEKETVNLFKGIIKKGYNVIDVGAHVGYFSLLISTLVDEIGKIFSFEPNKTNYLQFKKNIKKNNINNILALEYALSDKVSVEKFFFHQLNEGGGSLNNAHEVLQDFTLVKTSSLDELFNSQIINTSSVDFIKIDVEGHEEKVLKGMLNIIELYSPMILVEVLNYQSELEVIEFLKKKKYKFFIKINKFDLLCSSIDLNIIPYKDSFLRALTKKLF